MPALTMCNFSESFVTFVELKSRDNVLAQRTEDIELSPELSRGSAGCQLIPNGLTTALIPLCKSWAYNNTIKNVLPFDLQISGV